MPIFDTGFLSPTTNGTPSTYDGSATEFTNASNAYSSNDTYATVVDNELSYKYQSYGGFGINLDSSYIIKGIEVVTEGKTSTGLSQAMCLLEDSTSTYQQASTGFFTTTEDSYTFGGPTTLPSGTWTASGLADANFHVIFRTGSANDSRTISLDHIKIKVYYDTGPNINDSLTISESITMHRFDSREINDTISTTDIPTINIETLAVYVTEVISLYSLVYDANDGITYDTGTVHDDVFVLENIENQSIKYGHGGRGKGSTERHGV